MAEPLPLLIPHPALHAPRTGYPLARDEVNHVGEAVVMVVATDRYLAEDAAERDRGHLRRAAAGRRAWTTRAAAERTVHDDVPDNVAAHIAAGGRRRRGGDGRRAAHARARASYIERSASMPMEGKGVYARWDAADGSMRVYSSTQTSTGVRAAVAAKLGLPLDKVECIAPEVGGGFGVKIVHPWPEEVLVPWAARALGRRGEVGRGPARALRLLGARARAAARRSRVGFDDDGPAARAGRASSGTTTAPTRRTAIIVPIITSTQLLGPYKPGAYRVRVVVALHEHRDRHALPRRRPAAGRASRWSARWTRSPTSSGSTAPRCGERNFIHARRDALRPPADLPGRPAADLRLGRLPGVAATS